MVALLCNLLEDLLYGIFLLLLLNFYGVGSY